MNLSLFINIFSPLVLFLMMISMGMNLEIAHFKDVFKSPLPIIIGSIGQLLLLPLIAFAMIYFWPPEISPSLKIGLIILSACPGGIGSNVVAYLAKGDPALSVTLTLISSFSAVLTIPFLINFALGQFTGSETYVPLPLLSTSLKIAVITIAPIIVGMFAKKKWPKFTTKFSHTIQKVSIILLVLVVIGVLYKEQRILVELTKQAGTMGFTLCFLSLGMGFLLSKLFNFSKAHCRTIAIEVGLQNIFLAVIIATNFLDNLSYAVIPAVYSPITMLASVIIVFLCGDLQRKNQHLKT